jgi:energy-coupling factor transport system substrate-specific component
MREIFAMWRYTKMVVLTALTAAVYAALLIPFKGIPLIPGFTEIRVGTVVPVVFGILFGPAGAWGSALGNLIGDFFGTLSFGTVFGFIGNFFAALVSYKMWGQMIWISSHEQVTMKSVKEIGEFFLIVIISAVTCALIISWGLELINLYPLKIIGPIIVLNNTIAPLIIGPFLLLLLYPRIVRWDLLWKEIMDERDISISRHPGIGILLICLGAIGGMAVGLTASFGLLHIPYVLSRLSPSHLIVTAVSPFLMILLMGCLLA